MKIVVIGPDPSYAMASLVTEAFRQLGHEVFHFSDKTDTSGQIKLVKRIVFIASLVSKRLSKSKEKKLYQLLSDLRPDLVLAISVSGLYPDIIKKMKSYTKCVAAWYPDPYGSMSDQPLIASSYDIIFTKCRDIEARLRACEKRTIYLPEAASKKHDVRKEKKEEYACDIIITGSYYPYRIKLLEVLKDFDMKLYGIWGGRYMNSMPLKDKFQGKRLFLDDRSQAYSSAKIVINTLHPSEANSMNVRVFESACSGTFTLTEYRPVLHDLYKIGDELDCFQTAKELRSKVEYYLNNPSLALEIGLRGGERTLMCHTYENRVKEILSYI